MPDIDLAALNARNDPAIFRLARQTCEHADRCRRQPGAHTNTAFRDLHRLAIMLLQGHRPATTMGAHTSFALLFLMYELFEKFVAHKLSNAGLGLAVETQPKSQHALTEGKNLLFQMKPDLIVDGDIVIDTKWERLDPNERYYGVQSADVYQKNACL